MKAARAGVVLAVQIFAAIGIGLLIWVAFIPTYVRWMLR